MKKYIYLLLASVILASCGTTTTTTRGDSYPKMYAEKPLTILVMPPINKTVNVEAKEYFYTSMAMPLAEKGYYVISPFLAMDFLKSESAYDSEMYIDGSLTAFKNVFGVDIEYILKSTTSNEVLFTRKGVLSVDTSVNSGGNAGLLGALVDLAASAINTALTDKVIAARRCNTFVLKDLPEGFYSPQFGADMQVSAGGPVFSGTVQQ